MKQPIGVYLHTLLNWAQNMFSWTQTYFFQKENGWVGQGKDRLQNEHQMKTWAKAILYSLEYMFYFSLIIIRKIKKQEGGATSNHRKIQKMLLTHKGHCC